MKQTVAMIASSAALALGGCASAAPPRTAQANAMAAIRSAQEVGAPSEPRAAYHLGLAREQLETAQGLEMAGQMERAERVLQRAQADAELAIALARKAEIEAEAAQVRDHIRDMRERHL